MNGSRCYAIFQFHHGDILASLSAFPLNARLTHCLGTQPSAQLAMQRRDHHIL